VVQELGRRGWAGKRWRTRKGEERGGRPFDKTSLHRLLTNVAYAGQVRYKDELHRGEHPAVVDPAVFARAQAVLRRNAHAGGAPVRNRFGALLKGLLRCACCGCAMTPSHTTKGGQVRYRYYVCVKAAKRGWRTCPSRSVPAAEVERLVVERIRCVGRDEAVLQDVLGQARRQGEARLGELEAEHKALARDLARWDAELHAPAGQIAGERTGAR